MQRIIKFAFVILCYLLTIEAKAQSDFRIKPDTVSLKLDSLENGFLQKNLLLLAQRYNIEAQKALVAQAKLFPNPMLSFGTVMYQTATKQYFPVGNDGEISGGISQVILLAGKHNKQVKMAMTNASISEYQFYELIRTMKLTLQSDFFNIYFLQK